MSDLGLNLPSHTDRFFMNMTEMSNLVYDLVYRINKMGYPVVSPELVQLATGILQSYDRRTLIEGFITSSQEKHGTWDKIFDKDETFMHENALGIFSNLPSHHVEAFKSILLLKDPNGNPLVDQVDRDNLWMFFHSYVKIAIKFIHDERKPYCTGGQCRYAVKYFPEINLDYHAKKWGIKLPFPQKE